MLVKVWLRLRHAGRQDAARFTTLPEEEKAVAYFDALSAAATPATIEESSLLECGDVFVHIPFPPVWIPRDKVRTHGSRVV